MKLKFSTRLYWLFALLYIALILALVQVEKSNPESNIRSIYDGFWYSIVTLTTVGYGDYYPVTSIGKVLGLAVILSSLGVLGFLIGAITNFIQDRMEKKKKGFFGTDFSNHFVIIGWDSFAKNVVDQIVNAKCKVTVVTNSMNDLELIKGLYDEQTVFVLLADYENMEVLNKANIVEANSVYVNFTDDTKSLIYIINLKKYYKVNVVVALQTSELKSTFQAIGVEHIISKNDITSRMVASYIFEPNVAAFTEDLIETSVEENDFDMHEYKIVKGNPYLGMDYLDVFIDMKTKYNCVLVGITKFENGKRILIKNPANSIKLELNDYLIIISSTTYQRIIEKDFGVKEGIVA